MTARSFSHARWNAARWLVAIGLFGVSVAMPGTSHAFWSAGGTGQTTASVAQVVDPVVSAASPVHSDQVDVSWTPPVAPAGMAVVGYRVVRVVGASSVAVCDSGGATPLPASTTSCTDATLADGAYTYQVTADLGPWTASGTSSAVSVLADRTGPTVSLAGIDGTNALLARRSGSDRLFVRTTAPGGGSIRIDATVDDAGIGPASATFPAVGAAGWTHAAETVTTGSGSGGSVTYRSTAFTFTQGAAVPAPLTITGRDARANAGSTVLTPVADTTAPGGGALRVNGTNATAGGTISWATGDFTIATVTAFTEAASTTAAGIDTTVLTRESAALSAGTCGAFGGPAVLANAPGPQTGLPVGCYRYTLTGTDLVGNAASVITIVRLDTTAPVGGAVQANGTDAVPGGVTSISAATSWPLTRTDYTDAESGMTSSVLTRTNASLTGGACQAFGGATILTGAPAQSGLATGCYRYTLVGTNAVALPASVEVTVQVDTAAPTGGALTVNGTVASGATPTSNNTTGTVTVNTLTDYTDANIGLESSTLTRFFAPMTAGACGAYDAGTDVPGSGTFTVSGLVTGCHRFTLRGVDLAGNAASISTVVRVDTSAPAGGLLNVNGLDAAAAATMSDSADNAWNADWTHFSDPDSGVTTVRLARSFNTMAAGVCPATWGTATNLVTALTPTSGSSPQTAMTTGRCWRYILSATNAFGLSSSITTIVREDTVIPTTTGSLTVNASTAASTSTTGTYTISAIRTFADAQSGIASTSFTRTWGPSVAGVCGTPDPATTIPVVGTVPIPETTLPVGCYTYTQTGTNNVGLSTVVSVTVRVDSTAPIAGAVTANGTAAANVGTQSYSGTGSWTADITPFTDPESTVTNTLARSVATTLTNGTCGTFAAATNTSPTVVTSTPESGFTVGCVRYVLTGRNSLNLTAPTLTTTVRIDTSAPAGGVLTVNGQAATGAGSTSSVAAGGNFSITALTHYTDAQSGITSVLTRAFGPTCATVNTAGATTITGAAPIAQNGLASGCYRFVLTGTNGAGLTTSISTSVTVGP